MFNHQLTAFVCVADCGSFNKAAERLYLSPPAVMKQINALEKHLDLQLVDRTNQGIRLTPAGQVIYRHARYLFDYSKKAIAEARQLAQTLETTFCIGSSLLNPCKPFMDLWYQVSGAFPGYKLHVIPFEDDHTNILAEIGALGEKYDFLVGACDSAEWLERCRFLPLGRYPICCAMAREHPLSKKSRLTLDDLAGQTVMIGKAGDSAAVDAARWEILTHPEIHIEDTSQFYDVDVFNRCAQTQNLLLTLSCWQDVHPGLVTLPVDWTHAVPFGLLYAKQPPEDVEAFIQFVQAKGLARA